jgi:hypothetical protein
MDTNNDPIIEVFSGTAWEVEMVKTLLQDEEIESFITQSVLKDYAFNPIYSEGAKVMIRSWDLNQARCIINDYYLNMGTEKG